MVCGVLSLTSPWCSDLASKFDAKRAFNRRPTTCGSTVRIVCSDSGLDLPANTGKLHSDASVTGGAYGFDRATTSLTQKLISSTKKETGVRQAERCREALRNISFDRCFSSPISRAKTTAEVLWLGRDEPLVFLDSLKKAHLFFLEGMKNGQSPLVFIPKYLEAVEARQKYPKEYTTWRENPANFEVNGVYPVRKQWGTAREAWREIQSTPGKNLLVVTHKSILRVLICTALGLGPERFRAIDVNNGGISVFVLNKQGEAMLQSLNMTAHMYSDYKYFY
ncbi:hypothetical protein Pint_10571 [Pistacia integerrima]|uniref:Uncharacterized protein n=1 Tax=Pistacia integerrima TaxID=434235 RepID=A0ACC0XGX1_9ROSI|nr:hypothetical protein Pint_10571 [Pistacia integerrima]